MQLLKCFVKIYFFGASSNHIHTSSWNYIHYILYIYHHRTHALFNISTESLLPSSVIVLSCILAFFQIRTYVRNPPLRWAPPLQKLVSISFFFLNEEKPFGRTLFQGICYEDSAPNIRRKSCSGKGVSMATEEKKHLKSGANSMIFHNMISNNNVIFNNMIFNNMMWSSMWSSIIWSSIIWSSIIRSSIIWYDMTIVRYSTLWCTIAGNFEIH